MYDEQLSIPVTSLVASPSLSLFLLFALNLTSIIGRITILIYRLFLFFFRLLTLAT